MARFYGIVGFIETVESPSGSGIWVKEKTERYYYGTEVKAKTRMDKSDSVNKNLNVNLQISIVSDDYADQNLPLIRYVSWRNCLWEVTDVSVERPRLILTIGGVYNG